MIETERLILRVGTLEDAPDMMTLNADAEVVRYTGDHSLKDLAEAQSIVNERILPQWNQFKMGRFTVLLKNGTYLGWCGLRMFPENGEVDLGYRFMKKFWGHGYATEAARACLDYGFTTLNLNRIVAKTMPENMPSMKVLQKLGMTFKGYIHDPTEPHPYVVYELLKKDFKL